MKDTFSTYHPGISFFFYFTVLLCAMLFMHPVFLGISFFSAFSYSVLLKGRRAIKSNLIISVGMMMFSMVFNGLFNHYGVTPLWIFPSGNWLTLESLAYGLASGTMLAAVILWFSCYHETMTSDKFVYLFGRFIPALSLIFSMVLRFVPKYKEQAKRIAHAQQCIGRDPSAGNILHRAKKGLGVLSILLTWALENAIETSDSMGSRGYGLGRRTAFSQYRFDNRDRLFVVVQSFLVIAVLTGGALGQNNILYNPEIIIHRVTGFSIFIYACYALLCLLPICTNLLMAWRWRLLSRHIPQGHTFALLKERGRLYREQ